MTIYKYYKEIKNRTFLLLITWTSTIFISFVYKETLLFLAIKPTFNSSYNTLYFIFTDVKEVFYIYITIIMFLGTHSVILSLFYHLLALISLGLYKFEYKYLTFIFKTSFFCFLISIICFNNVLLPKTWNFFLSFQYFSLIEFIDLYFESRINEYLNFYISCYCISVFYFQIFVLLVVILKNYTITLIKIKQYRRFFYYSFIVISTILTPPDIASQIILSLSFIIFYEVAVLNLALKISLKNQPVLKH